MKRKYAYQGRETAYHRYYLNQAGSGGDGDYYLGRNFQKGAGLGSFLSGLFRIAKPLLWSGAKAVGKQALSTGVDVARDLAHGQNLKSSFRQRGKEAEEALLEKAKAKVQQMGHGRKRKPRRLGYKRKPAKAIAKTDYVDIFSPAKKNRIY